jgi:hypothetical protein
MDVTHISRCANASWICACNSTVRPHTVSYEREQYGNSDRLQDNVQALHICIIYIAFLVMQFGWIAHLLFIYFVWRSDTLHCRLFSILSLTGSLAQLGLASGSIIYIILILKGSKTLQTELIDGFIFWSLQVCMLFTEVIESNTERQ